MNISCLTLCPPCNPPLWLPNVIIALACSPAPRPKGAFSPFMIAFKMDHLPSILEGQSTNGLVVEYIGAIDATSIPGC